MVQKYSIIEFLKFIISNKIFCDCKLLRESELFNFEIESKEISSFYDHHYYFKDINFKFFNSHIEVEIHNESGCERQYFNKLFEFKKFLKIIINDYNLIKSYEKSYTDEFIISFEIIKFLLEAENFNENNFMLRIIENDINSNNNNSLILNIKVCVALPTIQKDFGDPNIIYDSNYFIYHRYDNVIGSIINFKITTYNNRTCIIVDNETIASPNNHVYYIDKCYNNNIIENVKFALPDLFCKAIHF